jgi:hypothetical protein
MPQPGGLCFGESESWLFDEFGSDAFEKILEAEWRKGDAIDYRRSDSRCSVHRGACHAIEPTPVMKRTQANSR